MNLHLNNLNLGGLLSKRLVFKANEKAPELGGTDKEKMDKLAGGAIDEARKKAKTAAIDSGKKQALDEKRPMPEGAKKLPEIPQTFSGLKFDQKQAKINPNGTVEQPFTFGDLKIKGKMILPEKPDPNAKTTYLFNYVDDPSKFDHAKFVEEMKKRQGDLGNTVIVTLKTPEGETKVDGKKVKTMETLIGNLEKLQGEYSKDPKFKDLKLNRPELILHMTDETNAKKLSDALVKYNEAVARDPRAAYALTPLDNRPEQFSSSLDRFAAQFGPKPAPSLAGDLPGGQKTLGGGVPSSGGGGMGYGGGKGSSSGGAEAPSGSAGPGPSSAPVETGTAGKEVASEGVNKLLIIGDSLMTGVENKIRANQIEKFAKVGKPVAVMLKEMQGMDQSGALEKYRNESLLINGGTNDIARPQEDILKNYQEIWAIAKKYNMKVFNCTIPPFGESNYQTLKTDYEAKNQKRLWLNQQIESLTGSAEGPYKIIPLHKKVSEGGLADDADSNRLAPAYKAPDGVHLNPEGYDVMAKAIQQVLGEPISPDQKPSSVDGAKYSHEGLKPATYSAELGEFATKLNQEFISSGASYGTKKTVEFNGKTYTAIFTEHNKKESTGEVGKFQATELWEQDPEAQKKSLNA
ncbi:hypothetical protein IT411_01275 [Candidatus Peregrinibacteria bacterium]|nr:hypothetical protein [Candidatus Peregrinibacteria bacterium]